MARNKRNRREELKKLLPIIQAYIDGATIQYNYENDEWMDCTGPSFDCAPESYRIKPEPIICKYRRYWYMLDDYTPKVNTCTGLEQIPTVESLRGFRGWIDDKWQEIEYDGR